MVLRCSNSLGPLYSLIQHWLKYMIRLSLINFSNINPDGLDCYTPCRKHQMIAMQIWYENFKYKIQKGNLIRHVGTLNRGSSIGWNRYIKRNGVERKWRRETSDRNLRGGRKLLSRIFTYRGHEGSPFSSFLLNERLNRTRMRMKVSWREQSCSFKFHYSKDDRRVVSLLVTGYFLRRMLITIILISFLYDKQT